MLEVTNTTRGDLGLDPDTVIGAGQTVEIDRDVLAILCENPVVESWFDDALLVAVDPKEAQEPKKRSRTKKATGDAE